ncbi:unnamed protein product [Phytophthora fragariaefolia]|uniref:Unnamed protein product n=1 Tax=Phytophthora fragariaefolia TaxID=1490495 RepID=A0A9W6Y8M2_9STRA|nr:unnamed protein product [Phytophthora fragariaefolia]
MNAETDSPAKAKKAKRSSVQATPKRKLSTDSPDSSQSSIVTGTVTAAIAEMEKAMPPTNSAATAPFAPDTPNLCLWANAAFDLLYKLQWQRVPVGSNHNAGANLDEILVQALSKAYKCPSCLETYGQVLTHRDDCDLKLLLDQGGHTDSQSTKIGNSFTGNHPLQWPSDKQLEWPDRPMAMYSGGDATPKVLMSPCNLSQDLVQLPGHGDNDTQVPEDSADHDFTSNLSINSWNDYASLSKLLYSTSYLEGKSTQTGTSPSPTLQWTGILPPVGTLSPEFPTLPSATMSTQMEGQHGASSQRFSALLAATKGMSTDAADLFRESEAALRGDGNTVSSLSNLSLSDLMRSSTESNAVTGPRPGNAQFSLSTISNRKQSPADVSLEDGVQLILASDFKGCGFPALDGSLALLGFYHLLAETSDGPAELRFMPSMFPLPEEMLRELESTILEWMKIPTVCCRRGHKPEDTLAHVKSVVLDLIVR